MISIGEKKIFAIDVVHVPHAFGFTHLVIGKCDLSGWTEGGALRGATAEHVVAFIWEDFVSLLVSLRHARGYLSAFESVSLWSDALSS